MASLGLSVAPMPPYRFGIEEEYFISDMRTRNVRHTMSKRFFRACKKELGDAVMNEMLQSQIEVATAVQVSAILQRATG
jgi:glutamate---cysteine ligase / carboxylate-amine ligase